jgi:beta-lysine 5,6-aminomutase beta subunit
MNRPIEGAVTSRGADPHNIKPYGDTMGDGVVQVSFSLPVALTDEAREAARRLAGKMGLTEPVVYHDADLGYGFSYFVVYGKCRHAVDVSKIVVPKVAAAPMGYHEINDFIQERIGRKVRVIGACTGSDAHTVGIDAIMNMKGFAGEYGLERYAAFETLNLGSQVPNEVLLERTLDFRADVVLVSQVVTQKDVHLTNLAELVDMIEAEGIRDRTLMICGGPRITHEVALELGFDAGFGPGTTPTRVASYVAQELLRRLAPRPG